MRLIHRERSREDSLEEGECYEHLYGELVSDQVEVIRLEPAGISVEILLEVETEHHVTTERLKGQFEERLAARARRSRRARPLSRAVYSGRLPERVRLRPRSDRPTCRHEIEKPGKRRAQSR